MVEPIARCTLVALLLMSFSTFAVAQQSRLMRELTEASDDFEPADLVAQRRQQLRSAIAKLDRQLDRARDGYAEGWKTYLHWDELTAPLNGEEADLDARRDIHERFRRDHKGLESPRFLAVRDSLHDFIDAVEITREGRLSEQYTATLEDLARRIEKYENNPTGLDGPEIGRLIGQLESTGQGDRVARAVQRRFRYSNIYGHASEQLLGNALNSYVDRTAPVNDVILGTTIKGTARFKGTQVVDTAPSQHDARLNILLRGTIHSNNRGWNGPVTIHSTGLTTVLGVKPIVVNENGVFQLPARSTCRTTTQLHDLSARCRLIEKIGRKRAGQQKAQAEAIASGKASARINASADREATGLVAQANRQFQEKFRWPLMRRGYAPKNLHVSSSHRGVSGRMLQTASDQIAAPSAPPPMRAAHDAAIQLHETFVANFSAAVIGGMDLTDEKLADMMKEATGNVPEELQITEDKEPWSMRFEQHYPIAAIFDGDRVTVYVRADRFTRGRNEDGSVDSEVNERVEISATYAIERTRAGVTLRRQGDVEVNFVGQEKLGAQQIGVKTFLRRKFEELFKEEFVGKGIEPKGRWARIGRLALTSIEADGGWISVAWQN